MQDWIERTIEIALDGPPHRAQVQAVVVDRLALHRSYGDDYWCVTHVPTGILIWWEYDREVAKHALMIFLASPIDWSHTDKTVYRRYEPLFKAAVAIHRRWRRHRAFRWNLRFIGRQRRRNRPNIRHAQLYRKLAREQRAWDRSWAKHFGYYSSSAYLLPTLVDELAAPLSAEFRNSRGPRRIWRGRPQHTELEAL